jgi:hypothetical protein
MSTPSEHLQRAESLIEQLEAAWADAATSNGEWTTENTQRLAALHLQAANARANIRSALTLQTIASLMAGNPDTPVTDPDTPGGKDPWTPPTNVRNLLSRRKQTE